MTVGVVLPHYKRTWTLEMSLYCWHSQTRPPDSVVVVDDGSPAGILETVKDLCLKFRSYCVAFIAPHKEFRLCQACNIGTAFLDTDTIIVADSDLIPTRNFVETVLEIYEAGGNMILTPLLFSAAPHTNSWLSKFTPDEAFHMLAPYYFGGDMGAWETLKGQRLCIHESMIISDKDNLAPSNRIGADALLVMQRAWNLHWDNHLVGWGSAKPTFMEDAENMGIATAIVKQLEVLHLEFAGEIPAVKNYFADKSRITGMGLSTIYLMRRSWRAKLHGST